MNLAPDFLDALCNLCNLFINNVPSFSFPWVRAWYRNAYREEEHQAKPTDDKSAEELPIDPQQSGAVKRIKYGSFLRCDLSRETCFSHKYYLVLVEKQWSICCCFHFYLTRGHTVTTVPAKFL